MSAASKGGGAGAFSSFSVALAGGRDPPDPPPAIVGGRSPTMNLHKYAHNSSLQRQIAEIQA